MLVLGLAMVALTLVDTGPALMAPAVLAGLGQALLSPASLALVSARLPEGSMGLGMGLVGAMRNGGKVAGPVLAGILIHLIDFESTFRLIGTALLSGGVVVWLRAQGWRGSGCSGFQLASSSYLNMSPTGICHPGTMSSTPSTSGSVSMTSSVSERCTFTVRLRGSTTITASVPAVSQSATFSSTSV